MNATPYSDILNEDPQSDEQFDPFYDSYDDGWERGPDGYVNECPNDRYAEKRTAAQAGV